MLFYLTLMRPVGSLSNVMEECESSLPFYAGLLGTVPATAPYLFTYFYPNNLLHISVPLSPGKLSMEENYARFAVMERFPSY
jgi:hypothetical protein